VPDTLAKQARTAIGLIVMPARAVTLRFAIA